jgi:UDP-N-acetylmuramate dehydrogenase
VPYSSDQRLINDLRREVKGCIKTNESLALHTSFKIGGPADIWVEPVDASNLKKAIAFARKRAIPFFVIGNGSNLLASDNGFKGMLIHLGRDAFKAIKLSGTRVRVGGGFSLPRLVNLCCKNGFAGMESLVGIPGTVGGAIYMNAGGYANPIYKNIGSMVDSLKVMDRDGNIKRLKAPALEFGYRSSGLGSYIILEAVLKLEKGDSKHLTESCLRFMKMKKEKHVLDSPNAGCVFKNPKDFHFTCGQMIDMLKLKGKRIGGAEISDRHANFIVNKGGASHKDVIELIGFIRKKVKENYNIDLELEVKII